MTASLGESARCRPSKNFRVVATFRPTALPKKYLPLIRTDHADQNQPLCSCICRQIDISPYQCHQCSSVVEIAFLGKTETRVKQAFARQVNCVFFIGAPVRTGKAGPKSSGHPRKQSLMPPFVVA
jgi:hypothetical protein